EYYNTNLELIKDFEFVLKHPISQKNSIVLGLFYSENEVQIVEIFYNIKEKAFVCQTNIISEEFKTSKKELFRFTRDEMRKYGSFSLDYLFFKRNNEIWSFNNSGDISSESDYSKNASLDKILPFNNYENISSESDYSKNASLDKILPSNNSINNAVYENKIPKNDLVRSWENRYKNNGSGSDIKMVVNEDKTAFAIAIDFNSQKSELLKAYLFDNRGAKKIESIFEREVKDKNYFFQNIQVSEDGNSLYLLGKSYADIQNSKTLGGKYQFELTKFTGNSQKSQYIDPKEHFITKLKTVYHKDEIICLGFYSDINDYQYTGISYFKIDPNSLVLLNENHTPFTEQFIIDKYGKLKEKNLIDLAFRNVFFTKTNELILTAEEESIFEIEHTGVSLTGNDINYSFEDIITAKLDSEGKLLWIRNINKKQHTFDDPSFISYTSAFINNETYFFINANEKIKKLSNDRIEFGDASKSNLNLNIIRMNQNGEFDFQKILDSEENEVPFMVAKGKLIDDSVLFLGRKGSKKQLLKVSL
ncbi:MAG: hypothetical protein GZ087_02300, partial [Flavobacterium sp.]|nr:hypothetical protein [Flavobacterium sp.]